MNIEIKLNKKSIGSLTFYKDYSDNHVSITFINVLEEYRGKGFGTALLWALYDYIYINTKFKYILWDDCSNNFRCPGKNIYKKVGAQYVEKKGPEMVWKIRTKNVIEKRREYIEYIKCIECIECTIIIKKLRKSQ